MLQADQPGNTPVSPDENSCVRGLTRKEFIQKVLGKAVVAGTLASTISNQIAVHPAVAAGTSAISAG